MYNHKIRVWKNAVEVKLKDRRIAVVDNEQDGTPGVHLEIRRLIDKDDVHVRCIYSKIGRVAVTSMNLSDEAMQALIGAWLELRKKQGFKMQKEIK